MININRIKRRKSLEQYTINRNRINDTIDIENYKRIINTLKDRDPYLPLSGNYRLYPLEEFNINDFNAEMDTISVDDKTISAAIEELYDYIKFRFLENEIDKSIYTKKISNTAQKALILTSGQFINGFTRNIDFIKELDIDKSIASVSKDSIRLPIVFETPILEKEYQDDHVTITVDKFLGVPDILDYSPQIIGSKANILNNQISNGLFINVYSYLTELIRIIIRANVDIRNTNLLTIYLNEPSISQFLTVDITKEGNKKDRIFSGILKTNKLQIPFEKSNVRSVYIGISQKLPNSNIGNINTYTFNIKKIRFTNTVKRNKAEVTSKAIQLKSDTKTISIVTDELLLPGTSIRYYISFDKDDNGEPINFFEVSPASREDNSSLPKLIKVGNRQQSFIIDHTTQNQSSNDWRYLTPETKFGGKIYKIGDLKSIVDNYNDIDINEDSIKLYRGIDDWSIEKSKREFTETYKNVKYKPVYDDINERYNDLPVVITYEESLIPINSNTFHFRYKPLNNFEYSFIDDNLKNIPIRISNYNGGIANNGRYIVETEQSLNPNTTYKVKYYINLSDITDQITTILEKQTTLYTFNGELTLGDDYEFIKDENEAIIRFKKSTKFQGEDLFVDLSVNFVDKKESIKYRTTVIARRNIEISIGPFNRTEIEAGNYHKINNIDVSSNQAFVLTVGKHVIESTQIFPEENQFTNKVINAFIDIPKSDVEMRGFEDSLRRVSIYELVLNSSLDDRQFAIFDGEIYINRIPDYNIKSTPRSEGKYLKTVYLKDDQLEIIPEKFRIEYNYSNKNETLNEIFMKLILSNDTASIPSSPEIRKIGINEYNIDVD